MKALSEIKNFFAGFKQSYRVLQYFIKSFISVYLAILYKDS